MVFAKLEYRRLQRMIQIEFVSRGTPLVRLSVANPTNTCITAPKGYDSAKTSAIRSFQSISLQFMYNKEKNIHNSKIFGAKFLMGRCGRVP